MVKIKSFPCSRSQNNLIQCFGFQETLERVRVHCVTVKGEKVILKIFNIQHREIIQKLKLGMWTGVFFLKAVWGCAGNMMKQRKLGQARNKPEFHCLKGDLWET